MKVVYFGTAAFAVPALRAVAEHVSLVVSQPDRPSGRGMRLTPSPVKVVAEELGLRVETPEKARASEFVERLRSENADLLLVAAYGQILSQAVLESAKRGGINLHGSILPMYRGAAPIQRAILDGREETGITLMQMDRGMDTGDIIAIERIQVASEETYGELQERLAKLAATMAAQWLARLAAGEYPRTSQNHEEATMAPKVKKEEAEIRFDRPAGEEHDKYRAFTPSPGAYFHTPFGRVRVSRAALGRGTGTSGEIVSMGETCEVAFREGSLHLLEVQLEGKKRMSGRDFANGLRLEVGKSLAP